MNSKLYKEKSQNRPEARTLKIVLLERKWIVCVIVNGANICCDRESRALLQFAWDSYFQLMRHLHPNQSGDRSTKTILLNELCFGLFQQSL